MTLPISALRDYSTCSPEGVYLGTITDTTVSGARVVAEWVLREWLAEPGAIRHAPSRGRGLRRMRNVTFSAETFERWRAYLEAGARSVDYVHQATSVLPVSIVNRVAKVTCALVLVDGQRYPFEVSLSDAVTVFQKLGSA